MEITLYAKKRTTKEGKTFFNYLSTLTDKAGETYLCTVKFRDTVQPPKPENCPVNIVIEQNDCNLSSRKMTRKVTDMETGEVSDKEFISYTLWVSAYRDGSPFVDHSMDNFF